MLVNDAGYDDGDDLSAGHDDGEDNWTKSDDSVIYEELTNSRTDAQDNTIKHESWILRHELQRSVENTLLKQRNTCQETRKQIDSSHHF